MTAVIIASQRYPGMHGLDEHLPLSLFPLVDRPLLHHIVEYLVGLGVRRFEFVLSHLPEKIEASLGDGARWGCSFGFHLIPDSASSYRMVRTIAGDLDDIILLGSADCLPEMKIPSDSSPAMFFTAAGKWSGWAVLPRNFYSQASVFSDLSDEKVLDVLARDCAKVVVEHTLSFRSGPELLLSQKQLMAQEFSGLLIGGRQSEKGIWISRNVSIHPTVSLQAPVYIGPNCRIGRGVRLGPCAVVSDNCILDSLSSVEDSVVAPGTYVGQGLELEKVLVSRNLVVNVKLGTSFLASETFLLSSLTEHNNPRPIQQLPSRLIALLIFLMFLPLAALIYLYMVVYRTGRFCFETAVRIPADDNPGSGREISILRFRTRKSGRPARWTHFFFQVWPGLLSVIRGDLFLVGLQPRPRSAIDRLPNDWKSIYLKCRAGLITEASVMFGDQATEDETFTAEAYYSATGTFRHDLRLACLYFRSLILVPDKSKTGLASDSRT